MRILLSIFLFSILPISGFAGEPAGSVPFFQGSFAQLKSLAQATQKPYFLSFQDKGIPSQNQSRYTYRDPKLRDYVAEAYLAMKVSREDQRPIAQQLIARYQIIFYPTIVIFSPNGYVLQKLTGYTNPVNLRSNLERYQLAQKTTLSESHPKEVVPQLPPEATMERAPAPLKIQSVTRQDDAATSTSHNNEAIDWDEVMEVPTKQVTVVQASKTGTKENPTEVPDPVLPPSPSSPQLKKRNLPPTTETEGLFRLRLSPMEYQGMAVQTGVYGNYQNVMREVSKLESAYQQSVIVHIDELQDKTVFRVLVGPLTLEQAEQFQRTYQQLEKKPTLIKNLKEMQKE